MVDDYDFKYIGSDSPYSNNNRFAWQFGLFNSDFLGIGDLSAAIEFTHLDPFFYSHKSNKSQYTNWGLSLGHGLRPNSDELAVKLNYWITSRVRTSLKFQFQRTGEGLEYDQYGNLVRNYGADINHGEGLYLAKAIFLDGNRVNNAIFTLKFLIEPVRQYFIDIEYTGRLIDKIYAGQKFTDQFLYITLSTDF